MSTLNDVVDAMSKETNNSTLGWDVVVNYTSQEINKLLAAAHQEGQTGQLQDITVTLTKTNDDEDKIHYVYVFKLGAPLIQFNDSSIVPACQLKIPVTGGTVDRTEDPKTWDIPADAYHLNISGIALASVDGKVSDSRTLIPSDKPFIFDAADMTGTVTLDLDTSASQEWLIVGLEGSGLSVVDRDLGNLKDEILAFFKQKGHLIHWNLSQVGNSTPPPDGSISLVPEKFRFAVYRSDDGEKYSVLSLFIHIKDRVHGGVEASLQRNWSTQWSTDPGQYGVSPIPNEHTASIIFNNALIQDLVEKSVQSKGMKIDNIPKTTNDRWGLRWKVLTRMKYDLPRVDNKAPTWPYSHYTVDAISADLDLNSTEGLYVTIGQNGDSNANALLKWEFSVTTGWSWIDGGSGEPHGGKVTITSRLDKKKYIDNSSLPGYRVRLDANVVKNDWTQDRTSTNSGWDSVARITNYEAFSKDRLPSPPIFNLELFDIFFFMTTNLLLPGENVIEFEANPGARFPRDLYLVGKVATKARAMGLRSQHLPLPS